MPDGTPIDLNFTTWDDANGPKYPGASDLNRIQDDISFLADPPSARLSRDTTQTFPTGLTFAGMYWNVVAWETDPQMIPPGVGGSTYTDKIYLPYVGEWEAVVVVRSQFNNTAGTSQIQLVRVFNNVETPIDQDTQAASSAFPNNMRIVARFLISQAMVDTSAYVRVTYAQNSGGDSAVYASATATPGIYMYPSFYVRWLGKGGL